MMLPVRCGMRIAEKFWLRRCNKFAGIQLRTSSTSNHRQNEKTSQTPEQQADEYSLVYRFPHIATVRGLARLKIYTTAASLMALPSFNSYVASGAITQSYSIFVYVTALAALGTLYYMGNLTRKLVGIISLHQDRKHVRVGRLTFWGNRRNIIVPIDTIIPLSEGSRSINEIYTDLKTYDSLVDLHISLKYGGIKDIDDFEFIFGKL